MRASQVLGSSGGGSTASAVSERWARNLDAEVEAANKAVEAEAAKADAHEIRVEGAWDDEEGAIDGKSDAADRTVPIVAPLRPILAAHLLGQRRSGFGS